MFIKVPTRARLYSLSENHMNTVHTIIPYVFKTHFNIVIQSTSTSPKQSLSFQFLSEIICTHLSFVPMRATVFSNPSSFRLFSQHPQSTFIFPQRKDKFHAYKTTRTLFLNIYILSTMERQKILN